MIRNIDKKIIATNSMSVDFLKTNNNNNKNLSFIGSIKEKKRFLATLCDEKGFSLIELIVVMAVIAILMLIAVPKFFGITEQAKETQIINDVRVIEDKLLEHSIKHNDIMPNGSEIADIDEFTNIVRDNRLYNKEGVVPEDNIGAGGHFFILPESFINTETNSRLEGDFISDANGNVYYAHNKTGKARMSRVPIVSLSAPEDNYDMMTAKIKYPSNSIQQEYKIGKDGQWIDAGIVNNTTGNNDFNDIFVLTVHANENFSVNVDIPYDEIIYARALYDNGVVRESNSYKLVSPNINVKESISRDMVAVSVKFPKEVSTEEYKFGDDSWSKIPKQGLTILDNGILYVRGLDKDGTPVSYGEKEITNIIHPMQMATGVNHSLALMGDGILYAWGYNQYGQLGDGSTTDKLTPVKVNIKTQLKQVSGGYNHSLALTRNGDIFAWGQNHYGQLGDSTTADRHNPIKVNTNLKFKQVVGGSEHSLALTGNGILYAWGSNEHGQLGNNTQGNHHTPVKVNTNIRFKYIAAGLRHSLALAEDGTLYAWGLNNDGQLGNGTKEDSYTPIKVNSNIKFKYIASGERHSLALSEDGTLYTWGLNRFGQLGNGTLDTQLSPIKVQTTIKFKQVAGGAKHSIALGEDGKVYAWGHNGYSQLGNDIWGESKVITAVNTDIEFKQITSGYYHSLALTDDEDVYSWGRNSCGQLGNDTKENSKLLINVDAFN